MIRGADSQQQRTRGELRDPRLDTGVRFCEDTIEWPAPGSEPTGALLFNASRYTTCRSTSGGAAAIR